MVADGTPWPRFAGIPEFGFSYFQPGSSGKLVHLF